MLDFGAINAGRFVVANVKFLVQDLMKEVESIIKFSIEMRNLHFECAIDPDISQIQSDPHRIKQILLNLIGNSIKFTYKGKIQLKAEIYKG